MNRLRALVGVFLVAVGVLIVLARAAVHKFGRRTAPLSVAPRVGEPVAGTASRASTSLPAATAPADERERTPAPEVAIHLPRPSVWPATAALGVTLALFGVVGGSGFGVAGGVLLLWAIGGWIGELRHE